MFLLDSKREDSKINTFNIGKYRVCPQFGTQLRTKGPVRIINIQYI